MPNYYGYTHVHLASFLNLYTNDGIRDEAKTPDRVNNTYRLEEFGRPRPHSSDNNINNYDDGRGGLGSRLIPRSIFPVLKTVPRFFRTL